MPMRLWQTFCTAYQRPCQNDAHENGTCETRLSSPEELANPRKRRGQANMLRAGDHVIMTVWCVINGTHSGECCGRVGVQRGICCVVEARARGADSMHALRCRPSSPASRAMDHVVPSRRAQTVPRASSLCLRKGTSYVSAGSFGGRRPEAIAAENGEVPILGTPFHTIPLYSHLYSTFSDRCLSYSEHQSAKARDGVTAVTS